VNVGDGQVSECLDERTPERTGERTLQRVNTGDGQASERPGGWWASECFDERTPETDGRANTSMSELQPL
jgi:hypothetical protein